MATHDANHILVTTNVLLTSGPWSGETCSWGVRVAASDMPLALGSAGLQHFETSDASSSGSKTINTRTYTYTGTFDYGPLTGGGSGSVTVADVDKIVGFLEQFFVADQNLHPTNCKLASFKVICPGTDGKAHTGSNVYTPDTTIAGTASGALSPDHCIVVSFYTSNLSKTGRGRIYWGPVAASVLGTNGEIPSATTALLASHMNTALQGIRDIVPGGGITGYSPVVWSRLDKSKGSVINRVRVGDELDNHETRTKQRPETYASSPLTS